MQAIVCEVLISSKRNIETSLKLNSKSSNERNLFILFFNHGFDPYHRLIHGVWSLKILHNRM